MIDSLILASASPARLQTLQRAGVAVSVVVSGVDESGVDAASTAELVAQLARLKAQAVFDSRYAASGDVAVVGCDSLLEFEGEPLGKPHTPERVIEFWRRLRGQTATLFTGHHVIVRLDNAVHRRTATASTLVQFADLDDAEIEAYARTDEPLEAAGAFTIDGLAGPFITRLDGDPHNVVGISLPLLRELLRDVGVSWTGLWRPDAVGSDAPPAEPDA